MPVNFFITIPPKEKRLIMVEIYDKRAPSKRPYTHTRMISMASFALFLSIQMFDARAIQINSATFYNNFATTPPCVVPKCFALSNNPLKKCISFKVTGQSELINAVWDQFRSSVTFECVYILPTPNWWANGFTKDLINVTELCWSEKKLHVNTKPGVILGRIIMTWNWNFETPYIA